MFIFQAFVQFYAFQNKLRQKLDGCASLGAAGSGWAAPGGPVCVPKAQRGPLTPGGRSPGSTHRTRDTARRCLAWLWLTLRTKGDAPVTTSPGCPRKPRLTRCCSCVGSLVGPSRDRWLLPGSPPALNCETDSGFLSQPRAGLVVRLPPTLWLWAEVHVHVCDSYVCVHRV